MAKEKEAAEELETNDEEEVFKMYGVTDDNAKKRIREMAAARTLHHRRVTPKQKKEKESNSPWED